MEELVNKNTSVKYTKRNKIFKEKYEVLKSTDMLEVQAYPMRLKPNKDQYTLPDCHQLTPAAFAGNSTPTLMDFEPCSD